MKLSFAVDLIESKSVLLPGLELQYMWRILADLCARELALSVKINLLSRDCQFNLAMMLRQLEGHATLRIVLTDAIAGSGVRLTSLEVCILGTRPLTTKWDAAVARF